MKVSKVTLKGEMKNKEYNGMMKKKKDYQSYLFSVIDEKYFFLHPTRVNISLKMRGLILLFFAFTKINIILIFYLNNLIFLI